MKLRPSEQQGKERLVVPATFKAAGAAGEFTGYASIFGNVDLGGDIVERGAFKEIVKNDAGNVVVLWQHNTRQPLGVASVKEDDKGLAFDGSLVMEDPLARSAYAHMKAGSVCGMSIGYDVLPGGADMTEGGVRKLKSLKLWEISVVTFGMNPLAGIDAVKEITTIRELEGALRDGSLLLNAREAKAVASVAWPALCKARDELTETPVDLAALIERDLFKSSQN
jgi:HK97 family phage prohead protease